MVFFKEYVKLQWKATSNHKTQRVVFILALQSFWFSGWASELAEDAIRNAASTNSEQFKYVKLSKCQSVTQDHYENGMFEQIVTNLETWKWLSFEGFRNSDELQMNTVSKHAKKPISGKPKQTRPL